jgi:polyhydroxyalkanoate synthesis regulator phasin
MSPSDLIKELRDGLTLGQIAQQKGVDPNKVRAAMLSVLTERIDQAVKNGKMTQDKANELTAKLEKQVDLNKRFQLPGKSPQDKPPKP